MTAEDALFPGRTGLWSRVLLPDRTVHAAAWRDAITNLKHVGICNACRTGRLKPLPPYRVQGTDWFPAVCVDCGVEASAHGPRPAEKKSKGRPA